MCFPLGDLIAVGAAGGMFASRVPVQLARVGETAIPLGTDPQPVIELLRTIASTNAAART